MAFDFDRLTIDDVSRAYGRRRALRHVSLTVDPGEIVGVLGPNGAGKSTLLAVLATLVAPSSGTVMYGRSQAVKGTRRLRAQIGFLSHDLQLYSELTARENLTFFAKLFGLGEVERRVDGALAAAGLLDRADDIVHGFSRGMRQRLALERSLLHRPRLVLLDEPYTGLDEQAAGNLSERLARLRSDGRMVVLATHDLDLVDGLLDRAVMLRDGRLHALDGDGTPLRERYRRALHDVARTQRDA